MIKWKLAIKLAVALAVAGVAVGAIVTTSVINAQGPRTVAYTTQERSTLVALESAFTKLAAELSPTVVHIRVAKRIGGNVDKDQKDDNPFGMQLPREFQNLRIQRMPQVVRGQGSGVIIRSDGYILTNDHVVGDADDVEVEFSDGRVVPGKVLRDFASDIALVKVNRTGLPTAQLGDSSNVKVGQFALAMGAPYGLSNTITIGHISALKRKEQIGDMLSGARFYPNLIQTDAAINPGNSGGPLVNIEGEVVGINTAIESGTGGGNVGIGFAIPINSAKPIIEQLMTNGKVVRGFLGVAIEDVTPNDADQYGVKAGALVTSSQDDTPAWKAGIRPGDIITEFNGKAVDSAFSLREMIAAQKPGTTVNLKYVRNHKTDTATAKLVAPPQAISQSPLQRGNEESSASGKLGVSIIPLNDQARKQYHVREGLNGAVVSEVAPGGPAEEAGIRPGDVIVRLNGSRVTSTESLKKSLDKLSAGDSVDVVVWRRDNETSSGEVLLKVKLR